LKLNYLLLLGGSRGRSGSLGWGSSGSLGRSSLSRGSSLSWGGTLGWSSWGWGGGLHWSSTLGRSSSGSLGRGSSGSLGWGSSGSLGLGSLSLGLLLLLLSVGSVGLQLLDVLLVGVVGGSDVGELLLSVVSLSLESSGSDESLDLRSLDVLLVTLCLGWSSHNVSADIESVNVNLGLVLLADLVGVLRKTEQLSDLVGSLRTESSGGLDVCESVNILLALGDDGAVESTNVSIDDASSNTSSLSLTLSSLSETAGSWWNEKSGSSLLEDTVLHWETVLVGSTRDSEDVSLVSLSKDLLCVEFAANLKVDDVTPSVLIINLVGLAQTVLSVCYDELHSEGRFINHKAEGG
jgi:hypothetical protein